MAALAEIGSQEVHVEVRCEDFLYHPNIVLVSVSYMSCFHAPVPDAFCSYCRGIGEPRRTLTISANASNSA